MRMNQEHDVSLRRRGFLKVLAVTAFAPLLGCADSIPPREYKRPRTHIVGGNGKRGRSRDGR